MNRLNIEVVQQVIAEIRQANEYPSNERIIERLGYGSKSTLTKLRAKYPSVFNGTNRSTDSTFHGTLEIESGTNRYVPIPSKSTDSGTRFDALEQQLSMVLERLDKPTDKEVSTTRIEVLEAQNKQLRRDLLACTNKVSNELEELDQKRKQVKKFNADNEALLQDNKECKQQFERIEADSKMLQEEHKAYLERLSSTEKERDEALAKVINIDSEKEAMASNYEAALARIEYLETPEQDGSKIEPVKPENELVFEPTKLINPVHW